jgi:FkbM family methyltransferase
MDDRLIYDVGVHVGDDTAYYLARGFRVVGIEADPLLAEQLKARFAAEIARGRLTLLNVGVAERDGEAQFWVSERPLWSSFSREMATRDGLGAYPVSVRTTTLGSIMETYGTPFYCKIDVEGFDRVCVQSLRAGHVPRYLSIEFDARHGAEDIGLLRGLGYRGFKIVSQVTRAQPSPALMSLATCLPYRAGVLLRAAERRFRGVTSIGDWSFGGESSGPFGDETPGRWHTYEDICELAGYLRQAESRREAKGLHDWFDLHAVADVAAERTPPIRQPQRAAA